MKMLIVWLIAVSSPSLPDYAFLGSVFNTSKDCEVMLSNVELETPLTAACVRTAIWVPVKPTDI